MTVAVCSHYRVKFESILIIRAGFAMFSSKILSKIMLLALIGSLGLGASSANAAKAKKSSSGTPIVMGYWENWGTYQGFPFANNAVLNAQLTGLNTIAYAFLEVASDGTLQFFDVYSDLTNSTQDQQYCQQFSSGCANYNPSASGLGNFDAFTQASITHHAISVGGAGHDVNWENAFNNPNQFVASLKAFINLYPAVDWLDIDYEPVGGVPANDIQKFIALVASIHQALPQLTLSYAITPNQQSINNFGQANWAALASNLTYVSVMGYDMHGSFDTTNPKTALHAALYANNDFSDDQAVHALTAMGLPSNKIILGMPMYGRAVGGVAAPGLGQVFTQAVQGDLDDTSCTTQLGMGNTCGGLFKYSSLSNYTATPVQVNGQLAGVYAYNAGTFISYDNPASAVVKAQYAVNNNLAGVMFWALKDDQPVMVNNQVNQNSLLGAVDGVYGIQPNSGAPTATVKLELTNNDPKNPITISLVTPDKSNYYPFPQLAASQDVIYTDANSSIVKTLEHTAGVLVLLTPAQGAQMWCSGTLNLANGSYHHIQVYYDPNGSNCLIN